MYFLLVGVVFTYLDEEYSYTVRDLMIASDLWEGLFINIQHEHLPQILTLGNIYRPPKKNDNNDVIHQLNSELRPIIDQLGKENKNCIITGDMDKVPRILRYIRIKRTFSENNSSDQIFEIRKKGALAHLSIIYSVNTLMAKTVYRLVYSLALSRIISLILLILI